MTFNYVNTKRLYERVHKSIGVIFKTCIRYTICAQVTYSFVCLCRWLTCVPMFWSTPERSLTHVTPVEHGSVTCRHLRATCAFTRGRNHTAWVLPNTHTHTHLKQKLFLFCIICKMISCIVQGYHGSKNRIT